VRAKKKTVASEKIYNCHIHEKKNNLQTKRLLSFIIACFLKNTSTIQSFREIKQLKRFILRDFHYTYQDFIAARQKNLKLDFDYNFFKLFLSIISN
jgi:hypothetical protein